MAGRRAEPRGELRQKHGFCPVIGGFLFLSTLSGGSKDGYFPHVVSITAEASQSRQARRHGDWQPRDRWPSWPDLLVLFVVMGKPLRVSLKHTVFAAPRRLLRQETLSPAPARPAHLTPRPQALESKLGSRRNSFPRKPRPPPHKLLRRLGCTLHLYGSL